MEEDKNKAYAVMLGSNLKDDLTPIKIFTSLLKAQCWCEAKAAEMFPDGKTCWEDAFTLYVADGGANPKEWRYDIWPADLDEDVEVPPKPEIEVENETLRKENLELRSKLSDQEGLRSAALAYLVMWDGGWKYSKEHVIENMHAARSILEKSPSGKASIEKLLERWNNAV